ncbi:PDZ domain-containing protein [Candidatus Bathyarchaeota archaeon]|nr:MAG: PDZ domain-containing protein [Candidatus Bathyarchaeota archaeon]
MASIIETLIPLGIYLAIWAAIFLIGMLIKADRFGVILKPYYFMLKTAAFNSWMERLGTKWRRGWLVFFDVGAAIGIGLSALALYAFIRGLIALFIRSPQATPTALIIPLPGLTISWEIFPYIILAIAVLLIPHEVAHGIASVLDRVPIKSSGVFVAVFLPGGFVEIDEEDLAKKPNRTKLRVFAAGSFTNVVSWFLVFLIASSIFLPSPSGVLVTSLVDGGGAQQAGVPQWSVITAVNGNPVSSVTDLSGIMSRVSPGQTVDVRLSNGLDRVVVTKMDTLNQSRAILGIITANYFASRLPVSPITGFQMFSAFNWMILILFNVAIVNMLPLFPFDGDRYFTTILNMLGVKNTKWPRIIASVISLGLLLMSLVLSFLLFGTIFLGR